MILHTKFIAFPNHCFSSSYRNFKTFTSSSAASISFCLKKPKEENPKEKKKENDGLPKGKLSEQSSWEAKDLEGKDYLYRLGKEADNMNIAVGARAGIIDDLFVGKFLGTDADIVFDYRQKATRSFEYLQGDYYIAPTFMEFGEEKDKEKHSRQN